MGENLLKVAEERERLIELLTKVLAELRDGRYDALVAQVEMERESQSRVTSTIAREKECAAKVAVLAEGTCFHERAVRDLAMSPWRGREVGWGGVGWGAHSLQSQRLQWMRRLGTAVPRVDNGTAAWQRSMR